MPPRKQKEINPQQGSLLYPERIGAAVLGAPLEVEGAYYQKSIEELLPASWAEEDWAEEVQTRLKSERNALETLSGQSRNEGLVKQLHNQIRDLKTARDPQSRIEAVEGRIAVLEATGEYMELMAMAQYGRSIGISAVVSEEPIEGTRERPIINSRTGEVRTVPKIKVSDPAQEETLKERFGRFYRTYAGKENAAQRKKKIDELRAMLD